jgi:CRISPR-associated protein Cmr3
LLTPAYFNNGYRPTWIEQSREGVKPELKAIAIQRPQVVSGWDFVTRGPKPTRRLAPAGTVLFISLKDNDPVAIRKWIENTWMHCISDNPQDNRDGFGLAVLGTWSGKPEQML